jgi:redox-sensitive bicupin YhaK (pirin superfamily)
VHFPQIWVVPDRRGTAPCYGQKAFTEGKKRGRLMRVASADGRDDPRDQLFLTGPAGQAFPRK